MNTSRLNIYLFIQLIIYQVIPFNFFTCIGEMCLVDQFIRFEKYDSQKENQMWRNDVERSRL